MLGVRIRIRLLAEKEEQIGDGIERIADFVRDGGSEASDLTQTIAGTQRLFGLAALRNIAKD